jgi:hypothetical protein
MSHIQTEMPIISGGADIAFDVCAPRPSDINYPHAMSEAGSAEFVPFKLCGFLIC